MTTCTFTRAEIQLEARPFLSIVDRCVVGYPASVGRHLGIFGGKRCGLTWLCYRAQTVTRYNMVPSSLPCPHGNAFTFSGLAKPTSCSTIGWFRICMRVHIDQFLLFMGYSLSPSHPQLLQTSKLYMKTLDSHRTNDFEIVINIRLKPRHADMTARMFAEHLARWCQLLGGFR